jgi:hypothetical protein
LTDFQALSWTFVYFEIAEAWLEFDPEEFPPTARSLYFEGRRVFLPNAGFPQGDTGRGCPIGQRPSPPP